MTDIVIRNEYGNSPKNLLLQKMTIAFAKGDTNNILGLASEDIHWHIIGDKTVLSKPGYIEGLVEINKSKVEKLNILLEFSHRKGRVVNGRK
jgi:hypothetical protein